jgi:alpha-glucosidase
MRAHRFISRIALLAASVVLSCGAARAADTELQLVINNHRFEPAELKVPVGQRVKLIVHNETSGGIVNYERQMEAAFAMYHSLGLDAIKSGYVTDTTPEGNSHHSQFMVRHYRKVIETAAKYHIMMDVHEPIHDTGERRTYPNMMSREGARGQEYNAWGGEGGNPPEHETNLYFTRMLAGPMDFTPGIFDLLIERGT